MKYLFPLFGIFALAALFFKLPEVPWQLNIGACQHCLGAAPYFIFLGSFYFTALVSIWVFFPKFPSPSFARSGLVWAAALFLFMSYLQYPQWCILCLVAHICHMGMWITQVCVSRSKILWIPRPFGERVYLAALAPFAVVALFASLNLTLRIYRFTPPFERQETHLQVGDTVSGFNSETGTIINFISSDCPFCKEQLEILSGMKQELSQSHLRIMNVTAGDLETLQTLLPSAEWLEDRSGALSSLFKVTAYPSLFVLNSESKIVYMMIGVSDELKSQLSAQL